MYALEGKKSEFWVHLDPFSKYLKYLRNFEKRSKLTKNSDFLVHGECATLCYQYEQRQYFNRANFSVNILQFFASVLLSLWTCLACQLGTKVRLTKPRSLLSTSPLIHTFKIIGYLGSVEAGKEYDATELISNYSGPKSVILIDQVSNPDFMSRLIPCSPI